MQTEYSLGEDEKNSEQESNIFTPHEDDFTVRTIMTTLANEASAVLAVAQQNLEYQSGCSTVEIQPLKESAIDNVFTFPQNRDALVLVDPRIAEIEPFWQAAQERNLVIIAVIPGRKTKGAKAEYYPTREQLLAAGVDEVYEPAPGHPFDVCDCAKTLKNFEHEFNFCFKGVIPTREAAVDYSDILAALLGTPAHNDLALSSARRDKGLMKDAVRSAGIRTGKFARLRKAADVAQAVHSLGLEYPVVIKTPSGFSTMDVYICHSLEDAERRAEGIIGGAGPNGKSVLFALIEEFIGGEEFAINLVASPYLTEASDNHLPPILPVVSKLRATDIWLYNKIQRDGTAVNQWQTMMDVNDTMYEDLVEYAQEVCGAVGIRYGFAHLELKAKFCHVSGKYVDPVLIEVAARLAGGRKAIMAQATISEWKPFGAMVDAHCCMPVFLPPTFSPKQVARQIYLPIEKTGIVKEFRGTNFPELESYQAHSMLCKVGDVVKKSKDLMSFAAYLWLVGSREQVEQDSKVVLADFFVNVCQDEINER